MELLVVLVPVAVVFVWLMAKSQNDQRMQEVDEIYNRLDALDEITSVDWKYKYSCEALRHQADKNG